MTDIYTRADEDERMHLAPFGRRGEQQELRLIYWDGKVTIEMRMPFLVNPIPKTYGDFVADAAKLGTLLADNLRLRQRYEGTEFFPGDEVAAP